MALEEERALLIKAWCDESGIFIGGLCLCDISKVPFIMDKNTKSIIYTYGKSKGFKCNFDEFRIGVIPENLVREK